MLRAEVYARWTNVWRECSFSVECLCARGQNDGVDVETVLDWNVFLM